MGKKPALTGNLDFIPLGDLLQILGADSRTGRLRLIHDTVKQPGTIYISDGNPFDAEAIGKSGKEAMYALFGWLDGRFEFYPEKINRLDIIRQRMMAIVLDALRELDEGGIQKIETNKSGRGVSTVTDSQKSNQMVIKGPSIEYISIVDEEEFQPGEMISQQGSHGDWIWVIFEGVVDFFKEKDSKRLKVYSAGPGAFIGGLSTLIQFEKKRNVTAIARGKVQLGVMDSQQLVGEFVYVKTEFRKILLSLDNRLRYISERIAQIAHGADKYSGLPNGVKLMIKQGDDVKKVFVVLQGNAYITRKTDKGMVYLMMLQKGDFIGNISIFNFDHEPSSANVYASPDLKLGILDTSGFNGDYEKLSPTIKNIVEYTTNCISAITALTCI